jgi:hypothetical protein
MSSTNKTLLEDIFEFIQKNNPTKEEFLNKFYETQKQLTQRKKKELIEWIEKESDYDNVKHYCHKVDNEGVDYFYYDYDCPEIEIDFNTFQDVMVELMEENDI